MYICISTTYLEVHQLFCQKLMFQSFHSDQVINITSKVMNLIMEMKYNCSFFFEKVYIFLQLHITSKKAATSQTHIKIEAPMHLLFQPILK